MLIFEAQNPLTVIILPSIDGNYRITVVPMYRHRYTYPFTVTKEITVKPMEMTLP
jgi:hypothetical protein